MSRFADWCRKLQPPQTPVIKGTLANSTSNIGISKLRKLSVVKPFFAEYMSRMHGTGLRKLSVVSARYLERGVVHSPHRQKGCLIP